MTISLNVKGPMTVKEKVAGLIPEAAPHFAAVGLMGS
jgi:hypothetical protein